MTTIATKMLVRVRNLETGESCEFSPFTATVAQLLSWNEWEESEVYVEHSDDYGMTWREGEN